MLWEEKSKEIHKNAVYKGDLQNGKGETHYNVVQRELQSIIWYGSGEVSSEGSTYIQIIEK